VECISKEISSRNQRNEKEEGGKEEPPILWIRKDNKTLMITQQLVS
jgi:hypothetical protein